MENKYFTPDIEDIHAGYECELLIYDKWEPNIVKPYTALESVVRCIKDQIIRVPYLTKEQIEAEGWEEHSSNFFKKDLIMLQIDLEEYNILIRKGSWFPEETLFKGNCKDINTFRKIIKLLNIK